MASVGAGVLTDLTGRGHTLTVPGGSGTPDRVFDPEHGWVLDFERNDTERLSAPSVIWTPTAFSFTWWTKPESIGVPVHQLGAVNGWDAFRVHSATDGAGFAGTDIATRFDTTDLPAGTWEVGVWSHFIYSYDGSNGRFYKDGELIAGPQAQTAPTAWGGFILDQVDGLLTDPRLYSFGILPDVARQMVAPDTKYDLYLPTSLRWWKLGEVGAPPAAAIMAQMQSANLGADLFDGALIG